MKTIGIFLVVGAALLLQGCGSLASKVPYTFEHLPQSEKVVAAAKAKIVVIQYLKPGVTCEQVKGSLKIVVKGDGKKLRCDSELLARPASFCRVDEGLRAEGRVRGKSGRASLKQIRRRFNCDG